MCCLVGDIYVLYRTLPAHSLLNKGSNNNNNGKHTNTEITIAIFTFVANIYQSFFTRFSICTSNANRGGYIRQIKEGCCL